MKALFLSFSFCLLLLAGQSQQTIPLYADSIPNSIPGPDEESSTGPPNGILIISKVSKPTLTIYPAPADKATGAAVIICPGGGYFILAAGHEGADVARKFNEMGITAFVLKYRIPNDAWMPNKEIGPLQDAQRAIQYVREHAADWKLKKDRIGIMGFSAGGHLASTAGTHFGRWTIPNPNKTSLRPDFMILVYPVISFRDSIGHMGSRDNLLGKTPAAAKITEYSNELQVTRKTPPAFLVHAKDDWVKVENSLLFEAALKKSKVPCETLIYESGGHGFGLKNPKSEVLWVEKARDWMRKMKWIP